MKKSIDLILYLDNKEIKIQEDILNKSIQKIIKNACTNEKIDFNDYLFFNINDVININNDSLLLKDIIKENDELNTNTLKIISFPKNKKIINEDCIIHSTNKPDEIRSIICPSYVMGSSGIKVGIISLKSRQKRLTSFGIVTK